MFEFLKKAWRKVFPNVFNYKKLSYGNVEFFFRKGRSLYVVKCKDGLWCGYVSLCIDTISATSRTRKGAKDHCAERLYRLYETYKSEGKTSILLYDLNIWVGGVPVFRKLEDIVDGAMEIGTSGMSSDPGDVCTGAGDFSSSGHPVFFGDGSVGWAGPIGSKFPDVEELIEMEKSMNNKDTEGEG